VALDLLIQAVRAELEQAEQRKAEKAKRKEELKEESEPEGSETSSDEPQKVAVIQEESLRSAEHLTPLRIEERLNAGLCWMCGGQHKAQKCSLQHWDIPFTTKEYSDAHDQLERAARFAGCTSKEEVSYYLEEIFEGRRIT
jgi:hypothetical protein